MAKIKVDLFIVIGNQFHSLGAALSVQNPVYLIDVYNQEVVDMSKLKDKVIKQRLFAINKLKDASKVGIIVGLKPGQQFGKYNLIKKKFLDISESTKLSQTKIRQKYTLRQTGY